MTSSRAILLVAITLAVSTHLTLARQYAVKTDWTGHTCTPGSGNGLITSEAYPTGSCLANYLKFDCNATHVRQWGCTLNETVCDCTIAYEYAIECAPLNRGGSRSWQCVDSTFDSYLNTLRTNTSFSAVLEKLNYGPQCSPADNLETLAFRANVNRCTVSFTKRSVEAATVLDYYSYMAQGCNSTGPYFYGCNDSACTDCDFSQVLGYNEFLSCYSDGNLYVNQSCLVVSALPAPIAAPVKAPTSNTPMSNGNVPSQASQPSGSAPTAPKAPSVKAPSAAVSMTPSTPIVVSILFVASILISAL